MILSDSGESSNTELLSKVLTLFFESEQQKNNPNFRLYTEINHEIRFKFIQYFAKHLFSLYNSSFQPYLENLRRGCEIAPDFMNSLMLRVALVAETENNYDFYWQLWKELSPTLEQIAIRPDSNDTDYRWDNNRSRDLLHNMLNVDSPWQKTDSENEYITAGKDLLLEFVTEAGQNPNVFEALASLMYHFPSIFFDRGVHILATHQKEDGGIRLLSGRNTAFYLEIAIQQFLQNRENRFLSKYMHEACLILIDAMVKHASSRAYYIREYFIRYHKIV